MKKRPAYDFLVENLLMSRAGPLVVVKPMFGWHGVYIDGLMYFILKHSRAPDDTDNGIWVATSGVDLPGLQSMCPWLKPLMFFENMGMSAFKDWLVLRSSEDDFEEKALKLASMAADRDERIGKVTVKKTKKSKKNKAAGVAKGGPRKKMSRAKSTGRGVEKG